jgi:hypothetical protein
MPEPSGALWCSRFPTSKSLDDLAEPFKSSVKTFLAALNTASPAPTVAINATLRPPERAYLMHCAWHNAREGADPAAMPAMAGVDILWQHPSAVAAAAAMVNGYGMEFDAALTGNHMKGLAVDMDITWSGTLNLRAANGAVRAIATEPRSNANLELQAVARTYGVEKLASDPPHWSVDGH